MLSSAAFFVVLALLCSILSSTSSLPQFDSGSSHHRSLTQASDSASSSCLGQTSRRITTIQFSCLITQNLWRPGNTYNDPAALKTDSPPGCCLACFADTRCRSWSYDTVTGACALKDEVSEPVGSDRFHSSGVAGMMNGTYTYQADLLPDGDRGAVAGFTGAHSLAPLDGCYTEAGVAYLGGSVLRRTTTAAHEACCELCRNDNDCYSWHRNANTRQCVLNRNIPNAVNRGGNFAGGAAI